MKNLAFIAEKDRAAVAFNQRVDIMPVASPVSYPGVYVQEVESPVHTITPIATSTTAFVGLTLRGELDRATLIHSFVNAIRRNQHDQHRISRRR
jgi:hypothetical protein